MSSGITVSNSISSPVAGCTKLASSHGEHVADAFETIRNELLVLREGRAFQNLITSVAFVIETGCPK